MNGKKEKTAKGGATPAGPAMPGAEWGKYWAANRAELEGYLEREFPGRDAKGIAEKTFAELAKALPHYAHSGDEGAGFLLYLKKMFAIRAGGVRNAKRRKAKGGRAGKGRPGKAADGEAVRVWQELYGMLRDVGTVGVREIDRATPNRVHWEIFCRICLAREKPSEVAAALGKSMAMVYQTKKRMSDRCRALGKLLYGPMEGELRAAAEAARAASLRLTD